MNAVSVSLGAVNNNVDRQVQIPLVIDLSYPIAGAQFAFEYSTGLEFVSYEKSNTVSSALTTPVVVKNGRTHLGFYTADNKYVPKDGKLDMGYLVFNCLNNDPQKITLTEIKLVQITDNGATHGAFLSPVEIKISSENVLEISSVDGASSVGAKSSSVNDGDGGTPSSSFGAKSSSVDGDGSGDGASSSGIKDLLMDNSEDSWLSVSFWVTLALLFVVACVAGVFIILKKRSHQTL
ncbi:MAG: hypothetical protein FWD52_05880 [Candidatus Bathyarchaeota archaeon]|nr:hypothetical protein [Candidatus Termiticorpusculum sp.]